MSDANEIYNSKVISEEKIDKIFPKHAVIGHPGPGIFEEDHEMTTDKDKNGQIVGIRFSRSWE